MMINSNDESALPFVIVMSGKRDDFNFIYGIERKNNTPTFLFQNNISVCLFFFDLKVFQNNTIVCLL
jgi:hypothetical protein